MPRTADHDERRRQVAEALLRTIARKGLAATTFADVADELGGSVGLVQRYFRSKSDLLRFGVEHLYQRGEERIEAVERVAPVRDLMFRIAHTLLPMDEERRMELTVWLEFLPTAVRDPEMAELHRTTTRQLVDGLAEGLGAAQRAGELSADLDPRAEAAALVALADGLTLHQLATPDLFDDATAERLLRQHFARLFAAGTEDA
ncbi:MULTISPECIES: TetR/AcrR family transcriptional regulator [unclassified Nocardiopsis]|uniref:TetR/AcrR family transcriptional regulator n=1 Tax=unclassified Nocardiopsis TaxID=2649073 RepID=UPI00066CF884|nr:MULTISPECIES: TetR family transcriptional regulator C-terminal domain-containing protein [unclassified Nocardiopsis]MBQ1080132.1 TetR family transcriptional regulator [Nocardiopsis sp. B62]